MLAAGAFVALASIAHAQANVGFGAGAVFPVNAYQVRVGYSLLGYLGFDAPGVLGARFEGGFNQFGVGGGHPIDVWSGTANLVVRIPTKSIHPYFITGIGYYSGEYLGGSSGKFGTNVGFGARVPIARHVAFFGELRVHRVFEGRGLNQIWYVPLTFGLQL